MSWCTGGCASKVHGWTNLLNWTFIAPFFLLYEIDWKNIFKSSTESYFLGYRNLNAEVEEGICQVMSYLWLESEILPSSSRHAQPSSSYASSSSSSYPPTSSKKGRISHTEKKLGEFFMHQIANDTSTAYGDGFRTAYAAINKYGLRQTLNHIRLTGGFPV